LLSHFRKKNNFSWHKRYIYNFSWHKRYAWMEALCPESILPPLPAVKSSIYRLETKVKQLKRNHRQDDINSIQKEPFIEMTEKQTNSLKTDDCHFVSGVDPSHNEKFETEVLSSVNKSLASELSSVLNSLEIQEAKTDEFAAKLSKLSVRNTNKKLKRRDEEIVELKGKIKG